VHHPTRRPAALVLILSIALLGACSDDGEGATAPAASASAHAEEGHSESSSPGNSTSGSTTPESAAPSSPAQSSAAPESTASAGAPAPAEARTVTATEGEMYIELSEDSFSPGSYTLEVVNEGNATHDLVVERDGADVAATETIAPGASATLTVTLEEGEYVFYCSIANHRAMGMATTVVVGA
jgi:plastocyanin